MARHWTKVMVWLFLSASMFGIAAWLTDTITEVNGRPAFDLRNPLVDVQNISVFTRASKNPVGRIITWYASDREGENPALYVGILAQTDTRLVLDNLAPGGCTIQETRVATTKYVAGSLFLIAPEKRSAPSLMKCKLLPVAFQHTFTRQTAFFSFRANPPDVASYAPHLPTLKAALNGFVPVTKVVVDLGSIEDADEFRFWSGYQDQTVSGFESARTLVPNDTFSVTWSDANREQLRDLYLVIIGTLVGIAVTMLIEALRIVIDTPRMFAAVPRVLRAIRRSFSKWVRAAAIEGS